MYGCIDCCLEFTPNYIPGLPEMRDVLNCYSITEDGERVLLHTTRYITGVAKNISPQNYPVILSNKEITRVSMLQMVIDGILSTKKAANLMGITARQVRNLKNRYLAMGEVSIRDGHPRSGRKPIPDDLRSRIIALARHNYAGYSLRKLQAVLSEQGIALHYSTIDRIIQGRVG